MSAVRAEGVVLTFVTQFHQDAAFTFAIVLTMGDFVRSDCAAFGTSPRICVKPIAQLATFDAGRTAFAAGGGHSMHAEHCLVCDASIGADSHYVLARASSVDAGEVGREPDYLCRPCGTATTAMVRMQRLRAAGNDAATLSRA